MVRCARCSSFRDTETAATNVADPSLVRPARRLTCSGADINMLIYLAVIPPCRQRNDRIVDVGNGVPGIGGFEGVEHWTHL